MQTQHGQRFVLSISLLYFEQRLSPSHLRQRIVHVLVSQQLAEICQAHKHKSELGSLDFRGCLRKVKYYQTSPRPLKRMETQQHSQPWEQGKSLSAYDIRMEARLSSRFRCLGTGMQDRQVGSE